MLCMFVQVLVCAVHVVLYSHRDFVCYTSCMLFICMYAIEGLVSSNDSLKPALINLALVNGVLSDMCVYIHVHLYDRCVGIQRHRHRLHIACSTVKT